MSVTFDPFALERYFARYEFSTRYLLCSSDAQSMPVRDLLALEPGSMQRLADLSLGYTESRGSPALRQSIASLYEHGDRGVDSRTRRLGRSDLCVRERRSGARRSIHRSIPVLSVALFDRAGDRRRAYALALRLDARRFARRGGARAAGNAGDSRDRADDAEQSDRLPFDRSEIDAVVEIARKYGLWLFSDEVYRGLEREAERNSGGLRSLRARRFARRPFEGLRSRGAAHRLDRNARRDALRARWRPSKITSRSATARRASFSRELALANREDLLERVRRIVARNLDCLDEFFARTLGLFEWTRPRAGTTAFPRYLGGSSEAFCLRAVEAGRRAALTEHDLRRRRRARALRLRSRESSGSARRTRNVRRRTPA